MSTLAALAVSLPLETLNPGDRLTTEVMGRTDLMGKLATSAAPLANKIVAVLKYPPLGDRSWGGNRFQQLTGMNPQDYLRQANELTVTLAMIETTAALAAVDDILAVPGIDGVFAGPSDLSITLLKGEKLDPNHQVVKDAFAKIMAAAKKAGKLTGCYAPSPERAKELAAEGWGFITLINDAILWIEATRDDENNIAALHDMQEALNAAHVEFYRLMERISDEELEKFMEQRRKKR